MTFIIICLLVVPRGPCQECCPPGNYQKPAGFLASSPTKVPGRPSFQGPEATHEMDKGCQGSHATRVGGRPFAEPFPRRGKPLGFQRTCWSSTPSRPRACGPARLCSFPPGTSRLSVSFLNRNKKGKFQKIRVSCKTPLLTSTHA